MPHTSIPWALSLAFAGALSLRGQILEYAYRQTGADRVALEQITFSVPAPFLLPTQTVVLPGLSSPGYQGPPIAAPIPAGARVELTGPNGPIALDRVTHALRFHEAFFEFFGTRSIDTFGKRFADVTALRDALPDGSYTIRYFGFEKLYPTVQFTWEFSQPDAPRVTNYAALQDWVAGDLTITWTPPHRKSTNYGSVLPERIVLLDASGTAALFLSIPVQTPGRATATGFRIPAGTRLTAELPFDTFDGRIYVLPSISEFEPVAMVRHRVLRFPIQRRPDAPPPPPVVPPPVVSAQPAAVTVLTGERAVLAVSATGADLAYQWRRDGVPISGATAATLTLGAPGLADADNYSVTITNAGGSVTSEAARLTVLPVTRIANVSVLTSLAQSGDSFTLGYVVSGASATNTKPLVIRVAGPALAALGVSGTVEQPRLELFAGATKTGENFRWGGETRLRDAMTAVGAFAFPSADSGDAAALATISGRDNSVKVSAANQGTGLVIAEIYDATPEPLFTVATPRLINVSVLKDIGDGLTAGFVIAGRSSKTVLIRAVGPGLAVFGVEGESDPKLELFSGTRSIAVNNDWSGAADLAAAFTQVGAFALAPTSKDAAVLATLAPGSYTAQVSGSTGQAGPALIEVYEVP